MKKLLLILFMACSVSVSANDPWLFISETLSQREQKIQSAIQMLNTKFPVLRVGLGDTGGLGHQSAGLEVVRSLLRLGYKGTIEVIPGRLNGWSVPYLKKLFSGFEKFPNLKKLDLDDIKEKSAVLGFVGGNDDASIIDYLNVEMTFSFQPLQWPRPRMICTNALCNNTHQNYTSEQGISYCFSDKLCFKPKSLESKDLCFHYDIVENDFEQLTNRFLEESSEQHNFIAIKKV